PFPAWRRAARHDHRRCAHATGGGEPGRRLPGGRGRPPGGARGPVQGWAGGWLWPDRPLWAGDLEWTSRPVVVEARAGRDLVGVALGETVAGMARLHHLLVTEPHQGRGLGGRLW